MIGDDELDLFVFLGSPKEILDEYTKLTGKSPLPPLWSFGLWMSRCTYNAESQVRDCLLYTSKTSILSMARCSTVLLSGRTIRI